MEFTWIPLNSIWNAGISTLDSMEQVHMDSMEQVQMDSMEQVHMDSMTIAPLEHI